MSTTNRNDTRIKYNQTKLIYICIMGSVFIYAFVVEMIKKGQNFINKSGQTFEINTLRYVLFAYCIGTFFIIKYLRKYLLSKTGQESINISGGLTAKLARIDIVTAALCESVAIYGLVLFFIGKRTDDFYTLMILSLMYFSIYFPRYSQWEEWLKKADPGGKHSY